MNILDFATLISVILLFSIILVVISNKKTKSRRKLWEENIYKKVVSDLKINEKRDGLWRIAMNEANGSEDICKSIYIKYCVQSIIGEHEILNTARY